MEPFHFENKAPAALSPMVISWLQTNADVAHSVAEKLAAVCDGASVRLPHSHAHSLHLMVVLQYVIVMLENRKGGKEILAAFEPMIGKHNAPFCAWYA
jgi:hypothetical protein